MATKDVYETKEYADYTYNSKNPLAKFAHRKRLSISLEKLINQKFEKLLDYGAGDLKYLKDLRAAGVNGGELHAYEPVMVNSPHNDITVYQQLDEFMNQKFDAVVCFEVLEHFNKKGQEEILSNIYKVLKDGGILIVSVPIEIGLVSLIKNARRVFNGNFSYSYLKNSFITALGQEVPSIRSQDGYLPTHLGFNHKRLERSFEKEFIIEKKTYSPFPKLISAFNSQVFYSLKPKH